MNETRELKGIASSFTDEQAATWMEEHLPELRQYVSGQRLLYQSLVISFVVGLAAHVGGYLLLSSTPSGLLGLLADLLHALGWSLWTGAVVAMFVQVFPEVKRRQIRQALDAYEALRHEKAQAVGDRDRAVLERPDGRRAERKKGQTRTRNRVRKGG
jgi:ABC-type molybdate transport system permease subunit